LEKGVRFGVYIPSSLLREISTCMEALGVRNRSRFIQEALRSYIVECKWRFCSGVVAGVVGVVYNHEAVGVDEELTDIQHCFLDIVVASMHIHLDREKCMLVIAVRGDSGRIRDFVKKISCVKGVYIAKPLLLETMTS